MEPVWSMSSTRSCSVKRSRQALSAHHPVPGHDGPELCRGFKGVAQVPYDRSSPGDHNV